jgi:hypothetical protein
VDSPLFGNTLTKEEFAFLQMKKTSYEYDANLADLVPIRPEILPFTYIQDHFSYSARWRYSGDNDTVIMALSIEPPPPPKGPGDPVKEYMAIDLDKVPFADEVQFRLTREIYRSESYKGFCYDPQPSSRTEGTFNLAPRVKTATAISGAAGVYGDRTQINIEFDKPTSKPSLTWDKIVDPVRGTDCGTRPLGGKCKPLNLGHEVQGRWLQGDTIYRIDVQNATGADAVDLGDVQFELKGAVTGPAGPTCASKARSPALLGTFATAALPPDIEKVVAVNGECR